MCISFQKQEMMRDSLNEIITRVRYKPFFWRDNHFHCSIVVIPAISEPESIFLRILYGFPIIPPGGTGMTHFIVLCAIKVFFGQIAIMVLNIMRNSG